MGTNGSKLKTENRWGSVKEKRRKRVPYAWQTWTKGLKWVQPLCVVHQGYYSSRIEIIGRGLGLFIVCQAVFVQWLRHRVGQMILSYYGVYYVANGKGSTILEKLCPWLAVLEQYRIWQYDREFDHRRQEERLFWGVIQIWLFELKHARDTHCPKWHSPGRTCCRRQVGYKRLLHQPRRSTEGITNFAGLLLADVPRFCPVWCLSLLMLLTTVSTYPSGLQETVDCRSEWLTLKESGTLRLDGVRSLFVSLKETCGQTQ